MIGENIEFQEEKDIKLVSTTDELEKVMQFIELNFSDIELSSEQLENCKKLNSFLTKNKINIEELESEILLEQSLKLNLMFNVLERLSLLMKVNNYPNMITLLDIYCQKNNAQITSDLEIELYGKESNNDLNLYKLYLSEIGQYQNLSNEEEKELAIRSCNGDIEARNKLVSHNLRLVVPIAKRYQNLGVSLPELILYGNEGIAIAATKFNPDRNCRFSTYATWWIKQGIHKGLREMGRSIPLPSHMYENIVKIKREINQYMFEHNGEMPSDEYLAQRFMVSVDKIKTAKKNMEPIISLSTPVGDEADATLGDMIVDEKSKLEELIYKIDITNISTRMLESKKLTEREREIIKLRCGFYGEEKTLEEIGQMYNLSRERIRQIEKVALNKILKATRTLRFETYSNALKRTMRK